MTPATEFVDLRARPGADAQLDDLRQPPITKPAPLGSYLITGLPRIRSAWLAALLWRDDLPCFHESVQAGLTDRAFGLSDPGAACTYPNAAAELFKGRPIVIVRRDEWECRESLERWAGVTIMDDGWEQITRRYELMLRLVERPVMFVEYRNLTKADVLQALAKFLTGRSLPAERVHLFQGLNVQQCLEVAKRRNT